MTTPLQSSVRDAASARSVDELVSDEFRDACKALKISEVDANALFRVAVTSFPLTVDNVLLLKGGRDVLAQQYEDALRANPAGELAYAPGQSKDIDDAIAMAVEAKFPRPTKVVRNEVWMNGCTVWFSVDDDAYFVDAIGSGTRQVGSAAAACALCDSGAGADALYPDVVALRETPVKTVPADDVRDAIE